MGATASRSGPALTLNNHVLFASLLSADKKKLEIKLENPYVGDIPVITPDDFKDLGQLEELRLQGRNVQKIKDDAFKALTNLRIL